MASKKRSDKFSEDLIEKPVAGEDERRGFGPDRLASALVRIIKRFAPKYGFVSADIKQNWDTIAGAEAASMAVPVKVAFPPGKRAGGTLYIKLRNASHAAVIQYQFPAIIDRVNTHFGHKVIKAVKVKP